MFSASQNMPDEAAESIPYILRQLAILSPFDAGGKQAWALGLFISPFRRYADMIFS